MLFFLFEMRVVNMRPFALFRWLSFHCTFRRLQVCNAFGFCHCRVMSLHMPVKYSAKETHIIQHLYCQQLGTSSSGVSNSLSNNTEQKSANYVDNIDTLVERLELHISRLARVKFSDVEHLLRHIKSGKVSHRHPGLLLLTCCSSYIPDIDPGLRLALARSIWDDLKAIGTDLDTDYYNALLKCYLKCEQPVETSAFLNEMDNVKPNDKTYQLLLECACEVGDMEEATHILQLMKENELPANEDVFSALILGYARSGDIKGAETVLNTMITAKVEPRATTYSALLKSYAEAGDIQSVLKTFQKAVGENIKFNERHVMEICKSLARTPESKLITKFLTLVDETFVFTPVVNNTVLELVHLSQEKAAYFLLKSLTYDPETFDKENAFAIFVNEMCNANSSPETVVKICNLLMETDTFSRALYKAIESSLRLSRTELALTLLRELNGKGEELRPHYFWPIILQRRSQAGVKGVLDTLQEMYTLDVSADFETLVDYVLPAMLLTDPEVVVQKLQGAGLKLRLVVTPIVVALLQNDNIQAALKLCIQYQTRIDFPVLERYLARAFAHCKDIKSCLAILEMMQAQKANSPGQFLLELLSVRRSPLKPDDVLNLLESFQKKGLKISTSVSDELVRYFETRARKTDAYQRSLKIVNFLVNSEDESVGTPHELITHPRNMSGEELEAHLVELKAQNMNTRGVLRRLFQHHHRTGNVKRALEVMNEFKENGFKMSSGMRSALFDIYVHQKDLKSAEACLADLRNESPGFVVDEYKIIDYATLLVLENQYKAAVTALERRAAAGRIQGGKSVQRNCLCLVSAVASTMDPDHTKHMLHTLVTYGYCSFSNVLLGQLIRSYIMRKNWDKAVSEFQRCAKEFKKTPMKQELLQSLLAGGSPDQLVEEVITASAAVHGKTNTFVAYAGALAECSREKQLRQFVSANSGILRSSDFQAYCQRLADTEKSATLTVLMNVCEGSSVINSLFFCDLLLQIHCRKGDCEEALNLWTLMQERDIQPSEEFLVKLASLLRSHNRPVPFVVPSDS